MKFEWAVYESRLKILILYSEKRHFREIFEAHMVFAYNERKNHFELVKNRWGEQGSLYKKEKMNSIICECCSEKVEIIMKTIENNITGIYLNFALSMNDVSKQTYDYISKVLQPCKF